MTADNFIQRTGIDGSRLELAAEFKASPYGMHSAALRAVLNYMRGMPSAGKHFLLVIRPGEEWALGQMSESGGEPTISDNVRFRSMEEGEWHVFRLRWETMFGNALPDNVEARS